LKALLARAVAVAVVAAAAAAAAAVKRKPRGQEGARLLLACGILRSESLLL
jgi:hypothetical protein